MRTIASFQNLLCAATLATLTLSTSAVNADDATTPIGDAIKDVPIFDAHIHYKEPAWGAYPVESIVSLMDRTGVAMGLVSSTPDEGTIELWKYAPNRIVPELRHNMLMSTDSAYAYENRTY